MTLLITGMPGADLLTMLATGRDDTGAAIEPFEDEEGGWRLRCCLQDSRPGDRLAVIGYSPFAWSGPYRETGPVVVHVEGCPGHDGGFPVQFEERDQVIRAFGDDGGRVNTQVYDRNRLVRAGAGLATAIETVLADPRVREVHAHNVTSQCFSFAATTPEDSDR
ncbi:DUF1203 domain-containing protein [Luteipulveratus flavus]|uniref:DUF1203 domain-containing protein n=1 Tax=Luteipulveratus flavus TaxID=3031728 RepID=A0ABT6C1N6_9MICO|nr:DUF1203 domain-containing protein [Luteipulveratus sp. YIM 133296]MDF8262672.1 DUF1203 domain-containing protein [Luteipulveratus sp. YIM 133296]